MDSFLVLLGVLIITTAFYLASLAIEHNYEERARTRGERALWQILFFCSLVLGTYLAWTKSGPDNQKTAFGMLVIAIGIVSIAWSFALFARALMARDHQKLHDDEMV